MDRQSDHAADHQTPEQRQAEHDRPDPDWNATADFYGWNRPPRPMTCCLCGLEFNYQRGWELCEDGPVCEDCVDKCCEAARRCLAEATTEAIRDLSYERLMRQRDEARQSPWWTQQDNEAPF